MNGAHFCNEFMAQNLVGKDGAFAKIVRHRRPLEVVIPMLQSGDIVVMDILGSHKSSAVRQALRAVGLMLFSLSKYSPDLNPIEMLFAKLKHSWRNAAKRTARPRQFKAVAQKG